MSCKLNLKFYHFGILWELLLEVMKLHDNGLGIGRKVMIAGYGCYVGVRTG